MQSKILLIFKYLWENTDEDNTVSIAELMQYLENNGVSANRKTVAKYIDMLTEFGIDIVKLRKTQNRYFIGTRHFEAPEVKLLIDAVQSSRFITPTKSRQLISKLAVFVNPNQSSVLKRHLYVAARSKSDNESIYINADNIQTAIAEQKKIRFQYFDYDIHMEQVLRHDKTFYTVSPYDLIWSNDTYYLAGFHETKSIVAKFRVDRMINLAIQDDAAVPKPADYSVAEFFTKEFSMFDGEDCEVTLICENALMNSIVDRFGQNIKPVVVDDGHFKVAVTVDLSRMFYGWVFASGGSMRIAEPKKAVDEFNNLILNYTKNQ